jgi:hypothetical protein
LWENSDKFIEKTKDLVKSCEKEGANPSHTDVIRDSVNQWEDPMSDIESDSDSEDGSEWHNKIDKKIIKRDDRLYKQMKLDFDKVFFKQMFSPSTHKKKEEWDEQGENLAELRRLNYLDIQHEEGKLSKETSKELDVLAAKYEKSDSDSGDNGKGGPGSNLGSSSGTSDPSGSGSNSSSSGRVEKVEHGETLTQSFVNFISNVDWSMLILDILIKAISGDEDDNHKH